MDLAASDRRPRPRLPDRGRLPHPDGGPPGRLPRAPGSRRRHLHHHRLHPPNRPGVGLGPGPTARSSAAPRPSSCSASASSCSPSSCSWVRGRSLRRRTARAWPPCSPGRIFLLAALAPFAVFRLIPFLEMSAVAGLAGGASRFGTRMGTRAVQSGHSALGSGLANLSGGVSHFGDHLQRGGTPPAPGACGIRASAANRATPPKSPRRPITVSIPCLRGTVNGSCHCDVLKVPAGRVPPKGSPPHTNGAGGRPRAGGSDLRWRPPSRRWGGRRGRPSASSYVARRRLCSSRGHYSLLPALTPGLGTRGGGPHVGTPLTTVL